MRIVIPMAGESRRFREAGFTTPKPFMLIDGIPMCHRLCRMFSEEDEFVFVVQKAHAAVAEYRRILEAAAPRYSIIEIEPNDLGPIYSALAADRAVRDNEPVILSYCDFHQHWDYRKFLWTAQNYEGAIAVFRGFHPASFGDTYYAYLRCDASGQMLELREKQSFTDARHEEPASTGLYYVNAWGTYKRLAQAILDRSQNVDGEYYISLIYNLMVEEGMRVITFEADRFICWGTPRDVEQYEFWSSYFRSDAPAIADRRIIHA